ncbi:MAG: hypothetical protein AAB436_00035 [Patescibacteria group bacterium]
METTNFADQNIEITAVYFRNNPNGKTLESYPKRMTLDGQEYTFVYDQWTLVGVKAGS